MIAYFKNKVLCLINILQESLPFLFLFRMDAREETLTILNRIWVKLQGLPNANPIELGGFFILLTFICKSLLSVNTYSCVHVKAGLVNVVSLQW